jgi:hypothetical protein
MRRPFAVFFDEEGKNFVARRIESRLNGIGGANRYLVLARAAAVYKSDTNFV